MYNVGCSCTWLAMSISMKTLIGEIFLIGYFSHYKKNHFHGMGIENSEEKNPVRQSTVRTWQIFFSIIYYVSFISLIQVHRMLLLFWNVSFKKKKKGEKNEFFLMDVFFSSIKTIV